MRPKTRWTLIVVLVAALATSLVGCGGGGGDEAGETGSSRWNEMVWNEDTWGPEAP